MEARVVHSSLHTSAEPVLATTGSASCYGRSEDVLVQAVVVSKLKLRDVKRKIFLADLMKRTHAATLEDRPKSLDGVDDMYCADHILSLRVVDDLVRVLLAQLPVAHPLIGYQKAHVIRDGFIHKAGQGFGFHVGNHASNHTALALYRSCHNSLFRSCPARSSVSVAVMPILGLATDKGSIHFDNAAELGHVSGGHRNSDPVTHIPSCFVGTESHVAANLQGAHTLLARQHQVRDLEPVKKRFIRVLENRSADVRKTIGRDWRALIALPMPRVTSQGFRALSATTPTLHAVRPTLADKVFAAGFLIRKCFSELWNGQLVKKLLSGHGRVSNSIIGLSHG